MMLRATLVAMVAVLLTSNADAWVQVSSRASPRALAATNATNTATAAPTFTGIVVGNSIPVTNGTLSACAPTKFVYFRRNAPYVSVHFSKFSLVGGDSVTITNADGTDVRAIVPPATGGTDFHSERVPGPTAVVTFTPSGCGQPGAVVPTDFGFEIDSFKYTYESIVSKEEACGVAKQYDAAICYKGKEGFPTGVYKASLAVARLLIASDGPTVACTGWLLGSEGHLLTNHHCIPDAATADRTNVEFMVQSPLCDETCRDLGDCRERGKVESVGTDFIYANANYDYALVKLRKKACVVNGKYGFLSLRRAEPTEQEKIFLVHHPNGGAKIITAHQDIDNLDNDPTTGDLGVEEANVETVNDENNLGTFWTSYYADTERGSSGAPVLSLASQTVIALHANGACKNSGAPSHLIIADLLANNIPLPADAFA